jgi:Dockerin type I domain/PEP-CTERM motif
MSRPTILLAVILSALVTSAGAASTIEDFFGDVNGDYQIDGNDLILVIQNFGNCGFLVTGDVNYDFIVDNTDIDIVRNHFGLFNIYLIIDWMDAGDANHDGHVDGYDLLAVSSNWNAVIGDEPVLYGDANLDGVVDYSDIVAVRQNFGQHYFDLPCCDDTAGFSPASVSAVPEPATLALLGVGLPALTTRSHG